MFNNHRENAYPLHELHENIDSIFILATRDKLDYVPVTQRSEGVYLFKNMLDFSVIFSLCVYHFYS